MYASIILLFILMIPLGVNAAPLIKDKGDIKSFHGNWVSDRVSSTGITYHQTLKLRCNVNKNYCKMRLITEKSNSCSDLIGEPTDALLKGEGQLQTFIDDIYSPAPGVEYMGVYIEPYTYDIFCLSKPPTERPHSGWPVWFVDNLDGTLTDNLGAIWFRKSVYE